MIGIFGVGDMLVAMTILFCTCVMMSVYINILNGANILYCLN